MRRREEQLLEREVLRACSAPDVAIFTNEVGQGYYGAVKGVLLGSLAKYGREAVKDAEAILHRHHVTYGLRVGSTDLVAVVGPYGRACFPELKSSTGALRTEQVDFIARMRDLGAVADEARSVGEVQRLLDAARRPR